ncbi:MAG: tyrosine-protein kinase family protein [Terriglobales bacterium]
MSRNFELLQRVEEERRSAAGDGHNRLWERSDAPIATAPASAGETPLGVCQPLRELSNAAQQQLLTFVTRLFLLPTSPAPPVVLFCGIEQNNSSRIAACIGCLAASQLSGPVCLIDAHLHHPELHEHFGLPNHDGLSEALQAQAGEEPRAHRVAHDLWLVTAGAPVESPEALLHGPQLRRCLVALRGRFRHLLIDAPAIHTCGDSLYFAQLASGAVLVLEARSTKREVAHAHKQAFEKAGIPVVGAILNHRTFPIPDAVYARL